MLAVSGLSGAGGGRPRTPTALKDLRRTARADRANAAEPRSDPVTILEPIRGLSVNERRAWVELSALVNPTRVATAADLTAFRLMVEAVGVLADLRASLRKAKGALVYTERTKSGPQLRQRPEIALIEKYQKLAMYHLARWGLTPADRSRVSALAEPAGPDPDEEFNVGAGRGA